MKIIGRKEEIQTFETAFNSKKSEFMAVYGRRRVGKTFLIHNYFSSKNCIYFHVTGIKNGKYKEQLEIFTDSLGQSFYGGARLEKPKNWYKAFDMLTSAISKIKKDKKVVLFF